MAWPVWEAECIVCRRYVIVICAADQRIGNLCPWCERNGVISWQLRMQ